MDSYYDKTKFEKLRYKFPNSESIERNYAQAYQDMFVLTMLNGLKNGTFVEIGTFHPVEISNTFLLDKQFGWSGLSVDINEIPYFETIRKSQLVVQDALTIDYRELFNQLKLPKHIDYLQLDIDPPEITLECLKKIPFGEYDFSVITYETDRYRTTEQTTIESREILLNLGYKLMAGHICCANIMYPFEDWYILPDRIDPNIVSMFEVNSEFRDTAEKYMIN